MSWIIPGVLFALAYLAWRWSWRTDLWLHAVGRFVVACVLMVMAATWALSLVVG